LGNLCQSELKRLFSQSFFSPQQVGFKNKKSENMKFLVQIQFLFVILVFISCSGSKTETVEVKGENGKLIESFEINKENGKKNGVRQIFDEEGWLSLEESYKDDVLQGKRTFFYKNGKPREVENYENGILVGEVNVFYENGVLQIKKYYIQKNGESVLEGILESYYDNGRLKEKITYVNGQLNGTFEEYHKNGKLTAKGRYREDGYGEPAEVGIIEVFDSTGTLIRKLDYTFDEETQFSRGKVIWKKE
jgi:antitoxin component YwqK of YwqJK toxin-antitoxin module